MNRETMCQISWVLGSATSHTISAQNYLMEDNLDLTLLCMDEALGELAKAKKLLTGSAEPIKEGK